MSRSRAETVWLKNNLAIATEARNQPVLLIDPTRPGDNSSSTEAPCPRDQTMRHLQGVAGAVIAQCGSAKLVGLVPEGR